MTEVQSHLNDYMNEALLSEDVYVLEAWNTVKNLVMDALGDEE